MDNDLKQLMLTLIAESHGDGDIDNALAVASWVHERTAFGSAPPQPSSEEGILLNLDGVKPTQNIAHSFLASLAIGAALFWAQLTRNLGVA